MENTFQPSLPAFQSKMAAIEAMELSTIGFLVWGLFSLIFVQSGQNDLGELIIMFFMIEGFLLGAWGLYNLYIRISRAGGRFVDYGLWVGTVLLTGSITLWCWLILDVNRLLMAKLLYRGEAPVEYAVSWRSKQRRKVWEQMQKASRF